MTADRDTTRLVRSWLRTDEHESADRVLHTVLARLDTTPQRRRFWSAWRSNPVNFYTKAAIAAAAALVVAVVGLRLLPASSTGPGGQPTVLPTAAPTATPIVTPSPKPPLVPSAGPLAIGRHEMNVEGVHLTFAIATPGWSSNGDFGLDKPPDNDPLGAFFIVWDDDADGIYSDPCAQTKAPPVGPTALDIASAMATVPGLEIVAGPTAVTVGGKPAQYVALKIPDELPCPASAFHLWYNESTGRYATQAGQTIRVWIVEVDGKRVQLDGETYVGAGPEIEAELQAVIDSIEFD